MESRSPLHKAWERDRLFEAIAENLARHGVSVYFDRTYVRGDGVRMALDAFELDFDGSVRTFVFMVQSKRDRVELSNRATTTSRGYSGPFALEFDRSGRHISEKSG